MQGNIRIELNDSAWNALIGLLFLAESVYENMLYSSFVYHLLHCQRNYFSFSVALIVVLFVPKLSQFNMKGCQDCVQIFTIDN